MSIVPRLRARPCRGGDFPERGGCEAARKSGSVLTYHLAEDLRRRGGRRVVAYRDPRHFLVVRARERQRRRTCSRFEPPHRLACAIAFFFSFRPGPTACVAGFARATFSPPPSRGSSVTCPPACLALPARSPRALTSRRWHAGDADPDRPLLRRPFRPHTARSGPGDRDLGFFGAHRVGPGRARRDSWDEPAGAPGQAGVEWLHSGHER